MGVALGVAVRAAVGVAVGVGVKAGPGAGVGVGVVGTHSTSMPLKPAESLYTSSNRLTPSALILMLCTEPLPAMGIGTVTMTLPDAL